MPLSVDTRGAFDLMNLPIPPGMRILKIEAEDYTDWTGDPALRVNVLLDESTDIERITGAQVGAFTDAIFDNLLERGIKLFPYVFFAKPSELADADEE
jgi:hypothetical protein